VTTIICGVDVSSQSLDACVPQAQAHRRVARSPEGIADLAGFCRQHRVELVVLEATGGYERLVHALLWLHQIPCAVVNPRQVRRFAEGLGFLEKTDRLDAAVIARFGAVAKPTPQPPASAAHRRLAALTTYRRQLVEARVALLNQRRLLEEPVVLASLDRRLRELQAEIRRFEEAIAGCVAADPLWQALAQAFASIKGVAGRAVAVLLSELPEIGTLDQKAVAKLIGLAPLANDSGKRQGRRPVRGGRASVRSLLVLLASLVVRHNPDFAAIHARLIAAGKPRMVARVAIARKLLVRLNAKARDVRAAFPAA
jgi:transposase